LKISKFIHFNGQRTRLTTFLKRKCVLPFFGFDHLANNPLSALNNLSDLNQFIDFKVIEIAVF